MNCPICKSITLSKTSLEPHLPSHPCGQCGGQWLRGEHYYQWLDHQSPSPVTPTSAPPATDTPPVHDSLTAKLCPECGRLLTRSPVGHGVDFSVDRCATCGGIWLDAHEWDALKSRHLHTALHHVFSAAWQADLRHQDHLRRLDALMTAKLGPADYAELKRLKCWLDTHPQRHELYAYLLNHQDDRDEAPTPCTRSASSSHPTTPPPTPSGHAPKASA